MLEGNLDVYVLTFSILMRLLSFFARIATAIMNTCQCCIIYTCFPQLHNRQKRFIFYTLFKGSYDPLLFPLTHKMIKKKEGIFVRSSRGYNHFEGTTFSRDASFLCRKLFTGRVIEIGPEIAVRKKIQKQIHLFHFICCIYTF